MAKDCRIGTGLIKENFPEATVLQEISRLASEAETQYDGDYTEVVKMLEKRAGIDLRVNKK